MVPPSASFLAFGCSRTTLIELLVGRHSDLVDVHLTWPQVRFLTGLFLIPVFFVADIEFKLVNRGLLSPR